MDGSLDVVILEELSVPVERLDPMTLLAELARQAVPFVLGLVDALSEDPVIEYIVDRLNYLYPPNE